jgi:hypothetical protein
VVPGGWCLECKHPYDADYELKQRAKRWGQELDTVRTWMRENVPVTADMIACLAEVQNREPAEYAELEDLPFTETPAMIECGETKLQTEVPSQAPVLPLATTPAGVLLAAEVAKHFVAPEAQLMNWLAHDLGRRSGPAAPRKTASLREVPAARLGRRIALVRAFAITGRRGNTEGTPPRARASTASHSFSGVFFFLRGFCARGFPPVPLVPASSLDGKEGVDGSSPSEGFI